jgi:hypothetical protein
LVSGCAEFDWLHATRTARAILPTTAIDRKCLLRWLLFFCAKETRLIATFIIGYLQGFLS